MRPVLVTGGAGFIGSHLAELLCETNEVVVIDDLSGGHMQNVPIEATPKVMSVCDANSLDELFDEYHFERVFHFAAYAAEGLSHHIRRYNYWNNVVGSANVINCCVNHGVERLVFASSIAVYGECKSPPFNELMTPRPSDPYGVAKYAVELDLESAAKHFGLKYTVFRPHNVYGERQNIMDPFRNVVGIFVRKALMGEHLPVFGDGKQTRAFTYVRDIAEKIVAASFMDECVGQTFDIGAGSPCSINDLANLVCEIVGTECKIKHLPERREAKHAWSSHDKADAFFGPSETKLADGIEQMVRWAGTVPWMGITAAPSIEVERDLPPSWQPACGL